MTLVDTSDVLCHPFVIGERACGNLKRRSDTLTLLRALPTCPWPTPMTC